ncbi:MAG: YigZ family protein [Methylophilaceae bacterium]|nr:YigZ family protein [Methylophilaceae bacterium]
MRILISEEQSELIVNKSKFIGYSVIANSREGFLDKVREIKINNPSASHAVYGLRIKKNTIEPHFSDDGEPSGTGGRPLISILESKKIINGGLVVVRYYGGINLGMGGLARAYSQAGSKAILASRLDNFIELHDYILFIKYSSLDYISKVVLDNNGVILDSNFDQNITLKIRVSASTKALIEKKFPTAKIQSLV